MITNGWLVSDKNSCMLECRNKLCGLLELVRAVNKSRNNTTKTKFQRLEKTRIVIHIIKITNNIRIRVVEITKIATLKIMEKNK